MVNKVFLASSDIDFEQVHQDILKNNFLQRSDFSFSTFDSGTLLLEKIHQESPDLVVIDRDLKDISGDKICLTVKNDTQLRKIPIIILLSDERSETLERCLLSGCDDYILKPLDIRKITAKIARLLRVPYRKDIRILFRFWLKGEKLSEFFFGSTEDLSISGMLFSTDVVLHKDDIIEITFFLPVSTTKITMTCKVVRVLESGTDYQYGVQFLQMEELSQQFLKDYLMKQAKPLD